MKFLRSLAERLAFWLLRRAGWRLKGVSISLATGRVRVLGNYDAEPFSALPTYETVWERKNMTS